MSNAPDALPAGVWPPSNIANLFVNEIQKMNLRELKVLDLGCGSGVLSIACAGMSAEVSCSDINPDAVEHTIRRLRENRYLCSGKTGDGLQPWLGEKFNLIVCNPSHFNYRWTDSGFRITKPCNYFPLPNLTFDLISRGRDFLEENGSIIFSFAAWQEPDLTVIYRRLFDWDIEVLNRSYVGIDNDVFSECSPSLTEKGVLVKSGSKTKFPLCIARIA